MKMNNQEVDFIENYFEIDKKVLVREIIQNHIFELRKSVDDILKSYIQNIVKISNIDFDNFSESKIIDIMKKRLYHNS
jgi:uncharacterized protein with HEPN domain